MRAAVLAVVCAVAVTLPGCGSDSDPEPPPDAGDGGTPTGGDGGGTPTGGGGSTPTGGGGTPSGGGGTPTGGGGSKPTGGGDTPGGGAAPAWPVLSRDGTLRIDRLDDHAECDGLVPTKAPDAVAVEAEPEPFYGCGGGAPGSISDGTGHVALAIVSRRTGTTWQAFTPGGAPLQRFHSSWTLFPQPEGWLGAFAGSHASPFESVKVSAHGPDGSPGDTVQVQRDSLDSEIHQWLVAEDPRGGVLLWYAWHDMDGSGRCGGDARRIGADAAPRGAPAEVGCWTVGAGVSSRGEALVLEDRGGELWVHWIRPDGTPASAPASQGATDDLSPSRSPVELVPLLDGSLVVRQGDRSRRYRHLATSSEPAPAWLAARSGWRFRNTRGNRGYAFFPSPVESPDCSQAVELRAPSGRLCGTVTLTSPGGTCTPGLADQGWDGTVVEKDARSPCGFRWWPRLLAKDG